MVRVPHFSPADPGGWIRNNTSRVNILLDAACDPALLEFLEAFLHLRLHPFYESGREPILDSQNPDWVVEILRAAGPSRTGAAAPRSSP